MTQACTSFSYPPTDVPDHWQQQQQQQRALHVPQPPDLSRVQGPVDQVRSRCTRDVSGDGHDDDDGC